MLLKPILHSRIGKWALALTEYSLTYKPLKAVKGQIVADFITDHSVIEVPVDYVELEPWILYFDGSRHKHGTGIGILIISPLKIPTKFKYKINGSCSNNEAEYEALIAGLEILLDLGARHIRIRGDSELVVKQLTKEYKCIQEHLMKYFVITFSLLKYFDSYDIQHVPRVENQEANDLAQIASGYKISKERFDELIEIKNKSISNESVINELSMSKHLGAEEHLHEEDFRSQNGNLHFDHFVGNLHFDHFVAEIFAIDNLLDSDWRKPIVKYLEDPTGITDRKVKYKALSYTIIGNKLFKKTAEGVLLKCLSENEAYLAVSNVHSGSCGAHQAGHKMKWLLFRQGLYWPSMLKDCIEYAKGCIECQKHAGIQHVPASELHSIVKPWPFRGWALDLIGEIRPASSKNHRYILVGIDYFTKWIEAIALPNVDQEAVINFIQNHIIHRFGLPETITTDQGTVFVWRKMQEFAEQAGFKLLTSTPYYAQANGQVKAANKTIIGLI
jgi:ribonuclease HI